jgi:hypothetical protein
MGLVRNVPSPVHKTKNPPGRRPSGFFEIVHAVSGFTSVRRQINDVLENPDDDRAQKRENDPRRHKA